MDKAKLEVLVRLALLTRYAPWLAIPATIGYVVGEKIADAMRARESNGG